MAEPNAVRPEHGDRGRARGASFLRQHPGQTRATMRDQRLWRAERLLEVDRRGGAAPEVPFEHQPRTLDDSRKLRIGWTFGAQQCKCCLARALTQGLGQTATLQGARCWPTFEQALSGFRQCEFAERATRHAP